jgi:hypothetical protein
MAEPLGIASGILSVVQSTCVVINYLHAATSAPKETQQIEQELVNISDILVKISNPVRNEEYQDGWESTLSTLASPDGPLNY